MDDAKDTVLIVDDNAENRALLGEVLKPYFHILITTRGEQAIRVCQKHLPDIVLLDIMMPEMDGYEVCRRLKSDERTQAIPVIFLTAKSQIADEQQGFDVGAVDYILKPISPPILLARVHTHLRLKQAMSDLASQNYILEERVRERTHHLESLQNATIEAMASLAETRDNETGNHIRRTQRYIKYLAEELVRQGLYVEQLSPETIENLFKSAPLHDIGKVGIPDAILLKAGQLTEDEFEIMKTHTEIGRNVIVSVESAIDFKCDFLQFAKEIAMSHQEKWDGTGYPQGLKAYEIPLSARLMALADVYDALISERVYKPAFTHKKAVSIIKKGQGTHFEPAIVAAFLAIEQQFKETARTYRDEGFHEASFPSGNQNKG
ncbi:response regulator [Vibrio spartinae]|uniref:Cyclic di-GMP phosphodiesterase response regulator RpfG n=1 Tax=Vibrio spartinae TaxID=1918945 RepID=A0A1N6M035_9VIBR|nr:two-component system response regulator [Vibrio spartinae]QMV15539.1 Cyclic di-GMP phosphodiesterase response regulator RpfG [Vibrio spartinae]SIO92785.1 Cyclic di-GMP phosphodiesterase response regulator RpfG [Vibrio spartinae]